MTGDLWDDLRETTPTPPEPETAPADPTAKKTPTHVSVVTPRNKTLFPFVMVTWVLGLVTGQDQCLWRAWFRSRYKYPQRPDPTFDAAAWTSQHDDQVNRRIGELKVDGWKVQKEGQNWIRLKGQTALLVAKPDIVAERGGQFLVVDEKTGQQNHKDWWQVLLYTYVIPKAWQSESLRITGQVEYADGTRIDVTPAEFTPALREKFFTILKQIGDPMEPPKTPSAAGCRFCDISVCEARIEATPEAELPQHTEDF